MFSHLFQVVILAQILSTSLSAASPTVKLDQGTFIGAQNGTVNEFLGIPFAKPPVGNLRFALPQPTDPYTGTQTVTAFGHACPQQDSNSTIPVDVLSPETIAYLASSAIVITDEDEDCLTVNVWAPANVAPDTNLPVLVWIYGGGFSSGAGSTWNGAGVVQRSIEIDQPIIVVTLNYRVAGFGFLASKEVKAAGVGNLGFQDQRLALRWVNKYINAFGGDPTKVTIWGESGGAVSCALHMVTNNGDTEGLFRAAIMQSGSPLSLGDITDGQMYYDALVDQTGCSGASDTLQCLREVDYPTIKAAVDASPAGASYQAFNVAWLPRVDGVFLTGDPMALVGQGIIAKIPIISGDCDDEGTGAALMGLNVTTDDEFREWATQVYLPEATSDEIEQLMTLYPNDPTLGSPFDTGSANALTPQYKRIAAFTGDLSFQGPRRYLLQHISGIQNTWSFLNKHYKSMQALGSIHGSDLNESWGPGDLTDYFITFVATLNPNDGTRFNWPQYTNASPQLLTLSDNVTDYSITDDTYRVEQIEFVNQLFLEHPLGKVGF